VTSLRDLGLEKRRHSLRKKKASALRLVGNRIN
jgi:hypothetical protein